MTLLACRFCANRLVVLGVALAILLCVGGRAIAGAVLVEAEVNDACLRFGKIGKQNGLDGDMYMRILLRRDQAKMEEIAMMVSRRRYFEPGYVYHVLNRDAEQKPGGGVPFGDGNARSVNG